MPTEFDLIRQYFSRPAPHTVLGGGDDCALVQPAAAMQLAISTDTLVAGVHFFADADPALLGWKSLAVNLSDLAAMGAAPRWTTLALTLPGFDPDWLAAYADGLYRCAEQFGISLIGGDTSRGSLSLTLTVIGELPAGSALRRDGARPDDTIWVSGCLGDAAFALSALQGKIQLSDTDFAPLAARLHAPVPRVALGLALRTLASSAIDISDGLLADLGHILARSQCGAVLEYARLPVSVAGRKLVQQPLFDHCLLAGGDDYELCFTAAASVKDEILAIGAQLHIQLTPIGRIDSAAGLRLIDANGQPMCIDQAGYDHFAS